MQAPRGRQRPRRRPAVGQGDVAFGLRDGIGAESGADATAGAPAHDQHGPIGQYCRGVVNPGDIERRHRGVRIHVRIVGLGRGEGAGAVRIDVQIQLPPSEEELAIGEQHRGSLPLRVRARPRHPAAAARRVVQLARRRVPHGDRPAVEEDAPVGQEERSLPGAGGRQGGGGGPDPDSARGERAEQRPPEQEDTGQGDEHVAVQPHPETPLTLPGARGS